MHGGGSPVSQPQVRGLPLSAGRGGGSGSERGHGQRRPGAGALVSEDGPGGMVSGLASPPAGPAWSPVSAITWLRDAEEVTPFLSPCSHLGKNQGQQLPCPASPSRGPGESVDEEVLCQPSRWHVKILMVSFI